MANQKLHIEDLRVYFGNQKKFSKSELVSFYRLKEPAINTTTVNWRIYNLVQKGIINRIGRGKFTLSEVKTYFPEITAHQISLFKKIKAKFPFINFCIWSTVILNEFMLHQPGKFYQLIEVEKVGIESVFFFLKDNDIPVYINPNSELIRMYLVDEKESLIVKPLITESPTQEINGINTVTIEKLLVDIFCNPTLFSAQQGSEMNQIFKNAYEKYAINENKMLRYASRRRKKAELDNFLSIVSIYRQ